MYSVRFKESDYSYKYDLGYLYFNLDNINYCYEIEVVRTRDWSMTDNDRIDIINKLKETIEKDNDFILFVLNKITTFRDKLIEHKYVFKPNFLEYGNFFVNVIGHDGLINIKQNFNRLENKKKDYIKTNLFFTIILLNTVKHFDEGKIVLDFTQGMDLNKPLEEYISSIELIKHLPYKLGRYEEGYLSGTIYANHKFGAYTSLLFTKEELIDDLEKYLKYCTNLNDKDTVKQNIDLYKRVLLNEDVVEKETETIDPNTFMCGVFKILIFIVIVISILNYILN